MFLIKMCELIVTNYAMRIATHIVSKHIRKLCMFAKRGLTNILYVGVGDV